MSGPSTRSLREAGSPDRDPRRADDPGHASDPGRADDHGRAGDPGRAPVPLPGPARLVHAAVAGVAAAVLLTQFVLTGTGPMDPTVPDPGPVVSVIRFFSFFTILSNTLVALTSLLLALGRPMSLALRVLRVDSLVAIVITAVVHWFLLRPLGVEDGILGVLDVFLHIVVPALAVLAWLVAGPRTAVGAPPGTARRVYAAAMIYPLAYGAWTFLHGALSGWYPYPFIDVGQVGYGRAVVMALLILLAFLVLAAALEGVERLLALVIGRGGRAGGEVLSTR